MTETAIPDETFKVWVEFDFYGEPRRAAWGVAPPEQSVVQIETPDMITAVHATAALKASIRSRYSDHYQLGAQLSGEF